MRSAAKQPDAADEVGAAASRRLAPPSQLIRVLGRLTEEAGTIVPTAAATDSKAEAFASAASLHFRRVAVARSGVSRPLHQKARCRATPAAL